MSIEFGELRSVRTFAVFVGNERFHVEVFQAFALLQRLQPIHQRAAIDGAGIEGADAFSKKDVIGTQVATKIEDFYSPTVSAVHLHVSDHSPARSPELLTFALACHFGSQRKLLVHTLPRLQGSRGLTLPDIPSEIPIRNTLSSLRYTRRLPK